MEDIIKLRSRYRAKNYLKKMPKPDVPTLRVGEVQGGNKFIDPSGGPMIVVGYELEEAKAVVKSIDFVEGYGYTITFE